MPLCTVQRLSEKRPGVLFPFIAFIGAILCPRGRFVKRCFEILAIQPNKGQRKNANFVIRFVFCTPIV